MHTKPSILLILISIMLHLHLGAQEPDYAQLWKKALKAAADGLPKTAFEIADAIRNKALSEKNNTEFIRALLFQSGQMASYEENHLSKAIIKAQEQLPLLDKPSAALMHSLIAEMYWFYYQQNRYQILDREAVSSLPPPTDLREWDASHFRNTISYHYEQSLNAQSAMDTIALEHWRDILESTDKEQFVLQPTLFDFVAGRALNYYRNRDAALGNVAADKPNLPESVWTPLASFVASNLPFSSDQNLQELRLIKKLLLSNLRSDHLTALLYNDIQRFNFLKDYASNNPKTDSIYFAALGELQEAYSEHEASALVAAARASFLIGNENVEQNNFAQALKICDQTIEAWPQSRGASQCRQLSETIRAKELSITVQRVVLPARPIALRMSYRNVTDPSFRIVSISSSTLTRIMELPDENMRLQALVNLNPLVEKNMSLPFEPDYRQHSTIIDLPPLPPGLYLLLASDTKQFNTGGITTFLTFQVSRLSFISRKNGSDNLFFLLDRESGKPVAKAQIRVMGREYDYRKRQFNTIEKIRLVTDSKGSFQFGPEQINDQRQAYFIEAYDRTDTLFSDNYFDVNVLTATELEQQRSWFFTDRSIYRPGQTVYFKGISLKRKGNGPWQTVNEASTRLKFFDANGREVQQIERVSNHCGSFEGSFTIPQNQLPGIWRIGNEAGSTTIEVASYKRPSFEVSLKIGGQQYRLGENVNVEGKAKAFAGYSLDSVRVSYRVLRSLVMPYRGYWWLPPYKQDKIVVAQGSLQTDRKGDFNLRFDALGGEMKELPFQLYNFEVIADVTDRNGETQSTTLNLSIGNQALFFETTLQEVADITEISKQTLSLYNAQHQSVDAEVNIRISLIEPNKRILRKPIWEAVDRQFIPSGKLQQLFPYDEFEVNEKGIERPSTTIWTGKKLVLSQSALFPESATQWPAGEYLLDLKAQDAYGNEVTYTQRFELFNKKKSVMPVKALGWAHLSQNTAQPGDTVFFFVGSAETGNRVLAEIRSSDKIIYSKWLTISNKLKSIPLVITEDMRGKLSFEAVFIRYNSLNNIAVELNIPFDNKKLEVNLQTHRDRLIPGSSETWTIAVKDLTGKGRQAEVLASMYDASLDVFAPYNWSFDVLPWTSLPRPWSADNGFMPESGTLLSSYPYPEQSGWWPATPEINWYGLNLNRYGYGRPMPLMAKTALAEGMQRDMLLSADDAAEKNGPITPATPPAATLSYLRDDFRETAFFYPQLQTDSLGIAKFSFRLPDALTRWKLLLLAHNNELQSGLSQTEITASKILMVVPNLPRFFRQGDTAFIAAKIVNTSEETLSGIARLHISDAATGAALAKPETNDKAFLNLKGGESMVVQWPIVIDGNNPLLNVNLSVTAGTFSDSEANVIPVLPAGVTITEAQALFVPANTTKTFAIQGLGQAGNQLLRLDIVSNPIWYALQALPWLEQKEHENSDQIFYRFYANSLAAHIASSLPETMKIIRIWQNQQPKALLSKLEKDEHLKSVLLSETPWVFEAADETRQQQQIALLFDLNRMSYEKEQMLEKLREQQLPDGAWGWFPGMPGNRNISIQIVAGMARLARIGAYEADNAVLNTILEKAVGFLDQEVQIDYDRMMAKNSLKNYALTDFHLQYLYTRSLLSPILRNPASSEVWSFLFGHVTTDWKKLSIDNQAIAAIVLFSNGKAEVARQIVASLKEKSLYDPLQGRWWKTELHAGGGHGLIGTQALLIEAFETISGDKNFTDGLRQWLLLHKQTNRWETSRATAEAVYALLLEPGKNPTEGQQAVKVVLGTKPLAMGEAEAGTGYVSKQWAGNDITPSVSPITLENPNPAMAWGSVFRQFIVPIDQVKSSSSQIGVSRQLFIEKAGQPRQILIPVAENQIHIGDRVRIRLIIETDHEMEFMHLKDYHAAAFEPAETLSGYRTAGNAGFYQAVNDMSTDFFFGYLPKGKYVIEYTLIATHEGSFANGYANFQSFYSPAFSAHSQGDRVVVVP